MGILVTDFDGTLTRRDFFDLVRQRWPAERVDPWDEYRAGKITHFEALRRIFLRVCIPEAEAIQIVESMEFEANVAETVGALKEKGWEVVVASAGCDWYIRHLLQVHGVSFPVHANPGIYDPRFGLQMSLPAASEFFSPETGIDKIAVVQNALRRSDSVAFAGDGPPDLEPALLVPAERRFARGWLAQTLRERGEHFVFFDRWREISAHLEGDAS